MTMRRVLALMLSALVALPSLSATIPSANKFVKPVQWDVGTLCSNASATSTQVLLKPCSSGTDTISDCTTGSLLQLTESSGDRLLARCFNPSGTTLDYSGFKMYLNDGVQYNVATVTTETYRGVNILGDNLIVENANGSGTGACGGVTNLIADPGFEGSSYNDRLGPFPTYWMRDSGFTATKTTPGRDGTGSAVTLNQDVTISNRLEVVTGGTGICTAGNCFSGCPCATPSTCTIVPNQPCGSSSSCAGDTVGLGANNGAWVSYLMLNKNTTYTLTFYAKLNSPSDDDVRFGLYAHNSTGHQGTCDTDRYALSGSSAAGDVAFSFSTWTLNAGSTCTFKDHLSSRGWTQFTATISTAGVGGLVSDPFPAELLVSGPTNAGSISYDDFAFCVPGTSVDATALTTRALTEDQLKFVPKVTRSSDTLSVGPFIGADISPKIAPSIVSGGSVTQTAATAIQAALPYTAPTGTYTLTEARSLVCKKPEVGTQRYAALFNWVTGWDQDADGTGVTCIADDESADELFGDKDCDGTKDAGENYIDSGGTVTGTGTTPQLPYWTSATALGSATYDYDGTALSNGCTVTPVGRNFQIKAWNSDCTQPYIATLQGGAGGVGNLALSGPGNTGGFTAGASSTSSFAATSVSGTSTYATGVFSSTVAAGGTAWRFDTTNTINSSGTVFSIYNNGVGKVSLGGNGLLTLSSTNLVMGSGTITGVGTPISFEAGAIDPSVTAPSSGVIGFDRDTDGNQEITDNSSGISLNPSDDGSAEWSITTLGETTHVHTPATTGGSAYTINQALPTGNYTGAMINHKVSPSTASTGPNGACVGGSAAGAACSSHATCTGGGECRDNSNSGDWNGFSFATAGIKGIWKTVYPVNVTFNTALAPYVNEAAASYFGISLTDTGHTDRVGGTSILFDDTLAAATITTNLVYGVNVGAGSWGYGVGSSPFVGLRVEDNSAASTNVKDVAGSHGISLLNGKPYAWGAALDTALSSASTSWIGNTDGTSRTIKAEGAIVVDSCSDTSSASTITVNSCNKVTITGSTTITTINTCDSTNNGRVLYLLCGTATSQITDGSNLKLVGNFTCATNGNLQLICDGTNWLEVSRSNPG